MCTVNEFFALEHLYEFIFQRDRCGLLIVGTGSDAHGQRDTIGIHKKSHLDQRQAGQIYLWILDNMRQCSYQATFLLVFLRSVTTIIFLFIKKTRCKPIIFSCTLSKHHNSSQLTFLFQQVSSGFAFTFYR